MTVDPQGLSFPLSPDHARQLEDLLATLSRDEALYISGYLAGFARQRPAAGPVAGPAQERLVILYGSETGHAAGLARSMAERAQSLGLAAQAIDMADFRPQELKTARQLVVITSTHGEGDPPDPAKPFFDFLLGRKAPRLDGTAFAVLGLGDLSYEHFCQAAKTVDQRLEELGARRIHQRVDCDVDYQPGAIAWIDAALSAFAAVPAKSGQALTPMASVAGPLAAPVAASRGPFLAPVLDTLVLNGRGSDKATRHVELSLAGSGLSYLPGDSLAIAADNDAALVAELMEALDLSAESPVATPSGEMGLSAALTRHYEITTLTPRFLAPYAEAAQAERLHTLLRAENRSELTTYCAGRQIIDVVREFPVHGLAATSFVAMLRPLMPRLYSLASSLAANPDEAHLTVAMVRYESRGRTRRGVASAFVDGRGLDDAVPVTVEANPNFRLPADGDRPIIMIGAGTGVAPFRAFLQDREAAGAPGPAWLFFGDRRFRTDFLYQTEWQRLLKDGRLTRMDVAFSRDQEEKVYVQHRLREQAKDLVGWLADGAHLYVCGDANRMAPDVHAALVDCLAEEGGLGRGGAEEELKRLQREKRYQRDIY